MSNVSKPVIPAEVADVTEYLRFDEGRGGYSNQKIIQLYEMKTVQNEVAESLRKIPFDTLLAALVNGYERGLTEEDIHEIIRRKYEEHRYPGNVNTDIATACYAYANGILYALDTLGIKIEGVNA